MIKTDDEELERRLVLVEADVRREMTLVRRDAMKAVAASVAITIPLWVAYLLWVPTGIWSGLSVMIIMGVSEVSQRILTRRMIRKHGLR